MGGLDNLDVSAQHLRYADTVQCVEVEPAYGHLAFQPVVPVPDSLT